MQDDKVGLEGAAASVRLQVTINTIDGAVNIIGTYWLNRHSATETSDQNLWRCLSRYVLRHTLVNYTPNELMQHTLVGCTKRRQKTEPKPP